MDNRAEPLLNASSLRPEQLPPNPEFPASATSRLPVMRQLRHCWDFHQGFIDKFNLNLPVHAGILCSCTYARLATRSSNIPFIRSCTRSINANWDEIKKCARVGSARCASAAL